MLAKNQDTILNVRFGSVIELPVGAGCHIYRGATIVVRQISGYAFPAADDTTDAYKQVVVGWAREEVDNSTGSNGAKTVRIQNDGHQKRSFAGAAQSSVGKLAVIVDDDSVQTYTLGSTAVVVGRITKLAGTNFVYVNFGDRPIRIVTNENE